MSPDRLVAPAVAGVLAAADVAEALTTSDWTGPRAGALLAAVLIPAPLAWARRRALLSGLAVCAAVAAAAVLLRTPQSLVVMLALLGAGFLIGYGGGRWRWIAGTAFLATVVLVIARSRTGGLPPSPIAFVFAVLLYVSPVVLGGVVRVRTDAARTARREAERAESEQLRSAALAVRDERDRIARELREVVTAAVGRIVNDARSGRAAVDVDPAAAAAAFDGIEAAGQGALLEMRRLLGALRAVPDAAPLAPQPRLADLGQLLAEAAAQGATPKVRVEGAGPVPAAVELCAYRLIEAALEDATVRFGPAPLDVAVEHVDDLLRVTVAADRTGIRDGDAERARLEAMRERAALSGGTLVGPQDARHRYRIRAELPVRP